MVSNMGQTTWETKGKTCYTYTHNIYDNQHNKFQFEKLAINFLFSTLVSPNKLSYHLQLHLQPAISQIQPVHL